MKLYLQILANYSFEHIALPDNISEIISQRPDIFQHQ